MGRIGDKQVAVVTRRWGHRLRPLAIRFGCLPPRGTHRPTGNAAALPSAWCLPRRRPPGTVGRCAAAPVGRREPSQFAALAAREKEVAPGTGPLRAIAIRAQVAVPARRALLTTASLTDAHPPTVTRQPAAPMATRLPAATCRHPGPPGASAPSVAGRGFARC